MDAQQALDRLIAGVFVGRELELRRFRNLIDDASAGHPHVVSVTGEAGIGKTALVQEVVRQARAQGWWALTIQCENVEGAPPYEPWSQLVREVLDRRDPDEVVAGLGAVSSGLALLVPEMFGPVRLAEGTNRPYEEKRLLIANGLAAVVRFAAQQAPTLLVLEDLQDTDESSLGVLSSLATRLGSARLLVAATCRDVPPDGDPRMARVWQRMRAPLFQRLDLSGLRVHDVQAMLMETGQKVPRRFTARMHELSGGNPLFLRELLLHLLDTGVLFDDGTRWTTRLTLDEMTFPRSVDEIIDDRLSRLSEDCRTMLEVACLFPGEFDVALIRQLRVVAPERLHDTVDVALRRRLIVTARTPGRFRFRHGVFREVLGKRVANAKRAKLHLLAAELLEKRGRSQSDAVLSDIAYHRLQAGSEGEPERAIDCAVEVAGRATERGAYERAAQFYLRALQLAGATGVLDDERLFELLLRLAEARHASGAVAEARSAAREAAMLAHRHHWPSQAARAALAFAGRVRGFGALSFDGDAVRVLEDALSAVSDIDERLMAHLEGRLAEELSFADERFRDRRSALVGRALERARRVGDPATLAAVLRGMQWALWIPEEEADRLAVADEIVSLASTAADRELVIEGQVLRCLALLEEGDVVAARHALEIANAHSASRPYYRWVTACVEACLATAEGELEEAERLAWRAQELGSEADVKSAELFFGAQILYLGWVRGRLAEIEPGIRHIAATTPLVKEILTCALVVTYAELKRFDAAREEFERLAEDEFAILPRNGLWITSLAFLAEACAALGDAARARQLYRLLEPFSGQSIVLAPIFCLGSVDYFLGRLAVVGKDTSRACHHFERAITSNMRSGTRQWLARTHAEYADYLLIGDGIAPAKRSTATAHLLRAKEMSRDAGLTRLLERIEEIEALQNGASAITSSGSGAYIFKLAGDSWIVAFESQPVLVKSRLGFFYVAELLRRPHQPVSCAALFAAAPRGHGGGDQVGPVEQGDLGPRIDDQARRAIMQEIRDIERKAEVARESGGDLTEEDQEALEALGEYLASARGLSGRDRIDGSERERCRQRVWQAIAGALDELDRRCPSAAGHLRPTIARGYDCVYRPLPGHSPSWQL